jgi:hypothetical protein
VPVCIHATMDLPRSQPLVKEFINSPFQIH